MEPPATRHVAMPQGLGLGAGSRLRVACIRRGARAQGAPQPLGGLVSKGKELLHYVPHLAQWVLLQRLGVGLQLGAWSLEEQCAMHSRSCGKGERYGWKVDPEGSASL